MARLLRTPLTVPENGYLKDACSGDLGGVAQARQRRLRYPSGGHCPRCLAPSRMRAKTEKGAPEHVPSSVPKDVKPDWALWLVPTTGYLHAPTSPIFGFRTGWTFHGAFRLPWIFLWRVFRKSAKVPAGKGLVNTTRERCKSFIGGEARLFS